ncbi:MAG TPA: extracellular solute-binding protein [Firmicutes bacterium]|jgi:multiple sugar transport system substrate-binding protein|nr:extracellular solute-binding protein [Bacillota bacterium]
MTKRLLSLSLVILVLVVCSQAAIAATSETKEPVTLVLANYYNGARIPLMDAQLRRFEEQYPWITVVNQVTGATNSTIEKDLVAIAAGMPPDVWMVDRIRIPAFVEQGVLVPLDDFISKDDEFNMDMFYKTEQELYKYKGNTYAVPMIASSVSLLYYNRTIFANAGYDPDRPPATWDDMLAVATRVQKVDADGTVRIHGGNIDYFPRYAIAQLAYTNGYLILDDPLAVNYLHDAVRAGVNWAVEFVSRVSKGGSLGTNTRAMQFHGEWTYFNQKAAYPDLDLGIGLLPHGPNGQSHALAAAGWSYAIPKGTKHPEESWLLIKYLTTSEDAKMFALSQGRPSPVVRFNQDRRYFETNPYWHVVAEAMNLSIVATPTPIAQTLADADRQHYSRLLARNESPENILISLQQTVDNIIAEYKEGRY